MELLFENPTYLWLLISIPLIILTHFFVLKHLNARAWKFANYEAIKRVTGAAPAMKNSFMLSKNILLLIIKVFVLLSMIFSIASPTVWYFGTSTENNYVLAIDASSSMLADDFNPNRFVVARRAAIDFLDSISIRTKVGLVSFAGTSFVDSQLTEDITGVKEKIATMQIKKVGGTDLGEALITSGNLLISEDKSRAIILLTDGRSTVGTPVSEGIEYARQNRITVYTIGVATEEGGHFLRLDALSKVDEESLRTIAESTGGQYFYADSEEGLSDAYESIANSTQERLALKLQFPLMLIALALIFTEWGLVNTRFRTLP